VNLTVYVPDGYSEVSGKYAAVYLLHGLDGDENEWPENGTLGTMNSLIKKNSVRPVIDGELDWSTVRNALPDALRYVSHKCQSR
jgi:hypothetical protein